MKHMNIDDLQRCSRKKAAAGRQTLRSQVQQMLPGADHLLGREKGGENTELLWGEMD